MSEEIKDIFECLKKYANLTPDAIDDLYYLEGYIEDLQQKVDRLNNIIDELEKWLKKEHENGYEVYYLMAIQDILDKLKELKNGDNK